MGRVAITPEVEHDIKSNIAALRSLYDYESQIDTNRKGNGNVFSIIKISDTCVSGISLEHAI